VVGAQSLEHAGRKAMRAAQSQGCGARKLAVILHRMWIDGIEFKWSSMEITKPTFLIATGTQTSNGYL
jgi:hypothetical protein